MCVPRFSVALWRGILAHEANDTTEERGITETNLATESSVEAEVEEAEREDEILVEAVEDDLLVSALEMGVCTLSNE